MDSMKTNDFGCDLPSFGENTKRDVFIKKKLINATLNTKTVYWVLGVGSFLYRNNLLEFRMCHIFKPKQKFLGGVASLLRIKTQV